MLDKSITQDVTIFPHTKLQKVFKYFSRGTFPQRSHMKKGEDYMTLTVQLFWKPQCGLTFIINGFSSNIRIHKEMYYSEQEGSWIKVVVSHRGQCRSFWAAANIMLNLVCAHTWQLEKTTTAVFLQCICRLYCGNLLKIFI